MPTAFRGFYERCLRSLLLGTLLSVAPAAAFYLAVLPFTRQQLPVVLVLGILTLCVILPMDVWLLRYTLRPIGRALKSNSTAEELSAGYARLLNLPWLVLVRIFGPHAFAASAVLTLFVAAVYPRMHFELDWHDYVAFWFLNLTVVPMGHVVYELTAVERNSHELANSLASRIKGAHSDSLQQQEARPFTLATRMRVFFPALALAPIFVVILAVLKGSEGLADFAQHVPMLIEVVISGLVGGAIFVYLMYRLGDEIGFQTRQLTAGLDKLAGGNLQTRVDLHAASEFGMIADHVNSMAEKLEERQHLRDLFGAYMTPEVAEKLLAAGATGESELRRVAILFVDVRGFTAFSRGRSPESILSVLNQFLEQAVEAVAHARGTVNKYLGDGLLAVFGAPVELENPSSAAFEAALQMSQRLVVLNRSFAQNGIPQLRIGIGLHAGDVVVGSIGSPKYKLEYTVIGDAVNVASRIEQLTKTVHTELLISQEVYEDLSPAQRQLAGEALQELVKGIEKPVTVFAIQTAATAVSST